VVALGGDIRQLKAVLPEVVVEKLLEKQQEPGFTPPAAELPAG
jgi:hypothetical protein